MVKTITPNSQDEKTKYLKRDYIKNPFLKGSFSRGLPARLRGQRQKEPGDVIQWAEADSRITNDQIQSRLPLSGHAAVDTVGYAKGVEEARASLKNICDP